MKTLILLLPLVVLAAAQSSSFSVRNKLPDFLVPGQCPTVDEKTLWFQQVPNHNRYAGRWYETARSKNDFQLVKQCTKNELSYDGPGFGFRHITTGLDANGQPLRRDGVTYPFTTGANTETPHLSIQFDQPSFASPYVILATDYDNYSCIYSCTDYNGNFVSDFLHVWSRSPNMNQNHFNKCVEVYRKHGLDVNRLEIIDQGANCNYDSVDSLLL
ncbi:unnamed protein product [Meganyctiphanes norvegica]|uniref:Lipocalin/cytosolic fatty-acid binding domain-containing protein n=1 Tax=Meganyctiphanes norvegica TaxID=48144 RepID=A0AAV2R046_MEGNR